MWTEDALVRTARGGDRSAFHRLVERYSRAILGRTYGCTREMASAEDLAQETLLRAWSGLERLRDDKSFGSWLLTIADNVCREWIRRKQTQDQHREALAVPPVETRAPDEPDPRLAEAIAELAPDMQQILALRHGREMSCEEIGRELGRPLGTVTKMLSRAYAELRERLVKR